MKKWFDLSEERRIAIFNQISAFEGLPAGAIEEDWWVTTTLRIVFSLPIAKHLVFKGGTSLSKSWNLIERFSEDIDLAIDRTLLGFEGELSKTQVKKLRKVSCSYISNDFVNMIETKIKELQIPNVTLSLQDFKDSDTDPLVVELSYKSLTENSPYLLPRVLIELGARSLMEPNEDRKVQSMIGSTVALPINPSLFQQYYPRELFSKKHFCYTKNFKNQLSIFE